MPIVTSEIPEVFEISNNHGVPWPDRTTWVIESNISVSNGATHRNVMSTLWYHVITS